MKILHTVEFYPPSVGGAQEVVRQLSERMVAAGHDVTVATTALPERTKKAINGVKIIEFDISGNAVVGYQGNPEPYREFLRRSDFDLIMVYAAQQWAADLFFEVMDEVRGKKVFVPCGFSALFNPDFREYFERMPEILKSFDATVYLSETYRDIKFAREHGVDNIHVIPNGADEREFSEIDPEDRLAFRSEHGISGPLIVSIGSHTGAKGHSEMLQAFERLPLHATFLLIGGESRDGCLKSCQALAREINRPGGKRVILADLDRSQTLRSLKAADLFLFLSNVEASPLVLFEAAAAGVPFVTSRAGNSAEIVRWTGGGVAVGGRRLENGKVLPSIWRSTVWMTAFLLLPPWRRKLGRKGRASWQKHFTWGKITAEYLKLYEDLATKD